MLDSHTHLNSWILFPDWQKHISDFEKEWWNRLVNAWSDWEYNENWITICKEYKWKSYIKCTLGLHPLEVVEWKIMGENIDEELKARNQLEWIGKMNNIKARAEEMVIKEVVYEEE